MEIKINRKKALLIVPVTIVMTIMTVASLLFLLPGLEERGGGNEDNTFLAFSSTWDTRLSGESDTNQIKLPLESSGTYDFTVDWGDGTKDSITSWDQSKKTHTYESEGVYRVNITGIIVGWRFNNGGDRLKLLEITQWGCLRLGNSGCYFYGCENLRITASDVLNLTGTITLFRAFRACATLAKVKGMNDWDVSSVMNMEEMFRDATSFNQNISAWDVSSVTNMVAMFYRATAFDQDIGGWNVSSVANMHSMFKAHALSTANYDSILIGWANLHALQTSVNFHAGSSKYTPGGAAEAARNVLVSNYSWTITDGGPYFHHSKTFMSIWDSSSSKQVQLPLEPSGIYDFTVDWGDGSQDIITSWDQSEKTHTYKLEAVFRINITGTIVGWRFNNGGDRLKLLEIEQWGDLRLGNSGSYFYGCKNLKITASDALDLTGTTNLYQAFRDCRVLDVIEGMNEWDVSSVTDMSRMFYLAQKFNQDIGDWNVSNVAYMSNMFNSASDFNQDIGGWDVSSVTDMSGMFSGMWNFNQDIGDWNVSSVTDMSYMFYNTHNFDQDIGEWDVSSVTDMSYMFYNDNSFDQDIGEWDVSSVTDMSYMFNSASDFNQDIGDWDVSSVIDMSNMFNSALMFDQDIGRWDVSNVIDMSYMFTSVNSFNQDIGSWDVSSVITMTNMFFDATLTTANYDSLLIGWARLTSLQNDVSFHAGGSRYTPDGLAEAARNDLISTYSWTITDGGEA